MERCQLHLAIYMHSLSSNGTLSTEPSLHSFAMFSSGYSHRDSNFLHGISIYFSQKSVVPATGLNTGPKSNLGNVIPRAQCWERPSDLERAVRNWLMTLGK